MVGCHWLAERGSVMVECQFSETLQVSLLAVETMAYFVYSSRSRPEEHRSFAASVEYLAQGATEIP